MGHVEQLKRAAAKPGSVPTAEVLKSLVALEKQRIEVRGVDGFTALLYEDPLAIRHACCAQTRWVVWVAQPVTDLYDPSHVHMSGLHQPNQWLDTLTRHKWTVVYTASEYFSGQAGHFAASTFIPQNPVVADPRCR